MSQTKRYNHQRPIELGRALADEVSSFRWDIRATTETAAIRKLLEAAFASLEAGEVPQHG